MIIIRKSAERGLTHIDWLKSLHTFSFGEYYDPHHMGFGPLRVINEDRVEPGKGFGMHQHHDMEIISYVIEGALEHKDSMGTGSIIRPLEIQKMSAGSGVMHSEFNPSSSEKVHFLQIWIIPAKKHLPPSYEQKNLPREDDKLLLIGSNQGGENCITIQQNVYLYLAHLNANKILQYDLTKGNGWLQVVKGKLLLNEVELETGDGAAIQNEKRIEIKGIEKAEFLLFDLFE